MTLPLAAAAVALFFLALLASRARITDLPADTI